MTSQELNLQMLKSELTENELRVAASKIAQETAGMSDAEKAAFVKGMMIGASALGVSSDIKFAARMMAALIVSASS